MKQQVLAFAVAVCLWGGMLYLFSLLTPAHGDETSFVARRCVQKNDEEKIVERCEPAINNQGQPYCKGYCERWEPVVPTWRCVGPALAWRCTETERGIEVMYFRSACGQNHPQCDTCGKWTAFFDDTIYIPWPMCQ